MATEKTSTKTEIAPPETDSGSSIVTVEPFEGPEKLLEVWFLYPKTSEKKFEEKKCDAKSDSKIVLSGLRSIPRKDWEEILKLVRCAVLNVVSNDYFDTYLLSESSLLVWPQKIILKTCGTTTLLLALPAILQAAKDVGLTVVGDVFYSRRNFFFQAKQLAPHSSFEDEVKFLDGIFDGSAYALGKMNGDHWYLYITDKGELADNSAPATVGKRLPPIAESKVHLSPSPPDFTLEVLMTKLDPTVMKQFWKKDQTAAEITKTSGIGGFFPDATIDDWLFDPCGYSMNGLLESGYFTIHITPQDPCSYVSFETNIVCDYPSLMGRILEAFKPSKFTVTLFAGHIPRDDFTKMIQSTMQSSLLNGTHSRRTLTRYEFDNSYELAFASYDKNRPKRKFMD